MNHRFLLEALERTLRDIMGLDIPFGGKVILLAGDFRQILPVVKLGSRAQIIQASIKKSPLWHHFKTFTLTENMRILAAGSDLRLQQFDEWLLRVGNGTIAHCNSDSDYVVLPEERCIQINNQNQLTLKASMANLVNAIFPNLRERYTDRLWVSSSAILCPKNADVDEINKYCTSLLPGGEILCCSADSTVEEDEAAFYPTEYLNSLNFPGMPPHILHLKPLIPRILLRNINPAQGLCNGTKVILLSVHGQLLKCVIAGGEHDGREVLLPRINFSPSKEDNFHLKWQRRQFPVRPAFAMTICKSQGQTLFSVGVWLKEPVFTHGQLYVASSRVGDPNSITYAICPKPGLPLTATRNIVYREILEMRYFIIIYLCIAKNVFLKAHLFTFYS